MSGTKRKGKAGRRVDAAEGATGGRATFERALEERPASELSELWEFWSDGQGDPPPADRDELLQRVREWVQDARRVAARADSLGRRLGGVFEELLAGDGYSCSYAELSGAKALSYLSEYDLEACLSALARRGLVVQTAGNRFDRHGERRLAVPREVGDALSRARRARRRGIFDQVTLRGHLDRVYSDPGCERPISPSRLREMYKMYSAETPAVSRVERLPGGIRELVVKAIMEFGGILPRGMFDRLQLELSHWNGKRWAMILEQSLVGTVQQMDLTSYGIAHNDETLVVFTEVSLAWLKRVAAPSDPDRPHEQLTLGIDVFTNIARFLAFLQEHDVRYTVKGEIFKTTEKKILQHLIPNPGRELTRSEVLQFIYQFCRAKGLVDGTGERTLSVTSDGRSWGSRPLSEKLDDLLQHALDERVPNTEAFHHVRLRQLLMRMLKRTEAGTWYDLMYLPFLARNQYLASLEDWKVEEVFGELTQSGQYHPMEDTQRLAWNLVKWVRQRLYLLGLVDIGYDAAKHPVALRLTQSGARLLGMEHEDEQSPPRMGTLVVTPDFEVVLFKSGDDAELMHDLDRFCRRERAGETVHFRLEEQSLRRALVEGMRLDRVLGLLEGHSRTPVPQNVTYSIEDWARRAGRMVLDESWVLACEDERTMTRLRSDPGMRGYLAEDLGPDRVRLEPRITLRRMRALMRDLGYLVELHPPPGAARAS